MTDRKIREELIMSVWELPAEALQPIRQEIKKYFNENYEKQRRKMAFERLESMIRPGSENLDYKAEKRKYLEKKYGY